MEELIGFIGDKVTPKGALQAIANTQNQTPLKDK